MTQALAPASFKRAQPVAVAARPALSRRQKAAIIVRLLIKEGAGINLDDLPEAMQLDLTREMSVTRLVDRATLHQVVTEFATELAELGISLPGDIEAALVTLEGALSASNIRQIRRQTGATVKGDPWDVIGGLGGEELAAILQRESIEIAAVVMSKIPVELAADILARLPGERARRITYAVCSTSAVDPVTVKTIGMAIAGQLANRPDRAFPEAPVARLGAILTSTVSGTRTDLLESLEETDADFAAAVRKAIFTFANIPQRIDPREVPKIARALDQTLLARALAFATGQEEPAGLFLLENMPKRLAAQLREQIEDLPAPRARDRDAALAAVVEAIREMESAGEITFVTEA